MAAGQAPGQIAGGGVLDAVPEMKCGLDAGNV